MDKNAEARKMFTENSSLLSFYVFSSSCFSTAARKQRVDLHRSKPLISLVLGQFFFLLFFVFSLTCYRVFVFFSLSGISLITLLCYVLYVNFVIVCYLAYLLPVLRVCQCNRIRRRQIIFFLGFPDHQPCYPQHLVSSFIFIVFSLISFCSRFKVVFLYCNYYFFALCRNLLFFMVW